MGAKYGVCVKKATTVNPTRIDTTMPAKRRKKADPVLPPSPYSFEETVRRVLRAKPPKKASPKRKSAGK